MKEPNIIPKPMDFRASQGEFLLGPKTTIRFETTDPKAALAASGLAKILKESSGLDLVVRQSGDGSLAKNAILLTCEDAPWDLGPEGYVLSISSEGIAIRALEAAGLYYGAQSLRQLLPINIDKANENEISLSCLEITDRPRFSWRGINLDSCRHFIPKDKVMKFIELLARHKMNRFHWHLTEDQGWRMEIKKWPKLTEVGAWRKSSPKTGNRHEPDRKRHGGFYTQDDIREVVAYAKERFITVVPEIEMPGHAQAAVASYPWLGNTGKPVEVATTWGIFENIYSVNDKTFDFLEDVLNEVLELFPSPYIHVGGDEAPKKQWKESVEAQAKMKELNLKTEEELQSYFIQRMAKFLGSHGRRLLGWDEITEGGLASGAVVMFWRPGASAVETIRAGHDVIVAPHNFVYFDHYQGDPGKEPEAFPNSLLTLEKVYSFEPVPRALSKEEAKHVLGAEGQLWTEYMPSWEQVEYMAIPRMTALAEVLWSDSQGKNFAEFRQRLEIFLKGLDELKVNYRHQKM